MIVKKMKYVGKGKPPFIPNVERKSLGDGVFEFQDGVNLNHDWEAVGDEPKTKLKKKKNSKEEAK